MTPPTKNGNSYYTPMKIFVVAVVIVAAAMGSLLAWGFGHQSLDGHPVMVERVEALTTTVQENAKKLDEHTALLIDIRMSQQRIETRLP
jgi:hypothetical protein